MIINDILASKVKPGPRAFPKEAVRALHEARARLGIRAGVHQVIASGTIDELAAKLGESPKRIRGWFHNIMCPRKKPRQFRPPIVRVQTEDTTEDAYELAQRGSSGITAIRKRKKRCIRDKNGKNHTARAVKRLKDVAHMVGPLLVRTGEDIERVSKRGQMHLFDAPKALKPVETPEPEPSEVKLSRKRPVEPPPEEDISIKPKRSKGNNATKQKPIPKKSQYVRSRGR